MTSTEAGRSGMEELAGKLTEAQRRRIEKSDVIVLRTRHDTRVALNLAVKGLTERGRHLNQFVLTPLGLALRAHLQNQGNPSTGKGVDK